MAWGLSWFSEFVGSLLGFSLNFLFRLYFEAFLLKPNGRSAVLT